MLDGLPSVRCGHGRDRQSRSLSNIGELLQDPHYRQDRVEYETLQKEKLSITEFLTDDWSPIDLHDCSLLGNVHGYVQEEALKKIRIESANITIIGNLIRSPYFFFRSYINMVTQNFFLYPEKFNSIHVPRINQNQAIISKLNPTISNLISDAFAEALYATKQMLRDVEIRPELQLRMEDLTSSKRSLFEFIEENFCNIDSSVSKYIEEKINNRRVNSHVDSPRTQSHPDINSFLEFDFNSIAEWDPSWLELMSGYLSEERVTIGRFYPEDALLSLL